MAYSTLLTDSTVGAVTQVFGNDGHYGTDIQFSPLYYSNLFAPVAGLVTTSAYGSAGLDWTYGEHYEVLCDDGTRYRMAHLRLNSRAVSAGNRVVAGQYMGKQGNTGNVEGETGIHLHLELFTASGVRVSPEPLMGFPDALGRYDLEWGSPDPPEPEPPPVGARSKTKLFIYVSRHPHNRR